MQPNTEASAWIDIMSTKNLNQHERQAEIDRFSFCTLLFVENVKKKVDEIFLLKTLNTSLMVRVCMTSSLVDTFDFLGFFFVQCHDKSCLCGDVKIDENILF